jgi:hypothetical protein
VLAVPSSGDPERGPVARSRASAIVELLKSRKAALAEALFANSAKAPLDLTEADISALFAPLDYT